MTTQFEPKCEYIATNCNSSYEAYDWISNSIVAFGSCNNIYIYDIHSIYIDFSSNLHTGNVSTIKCFNFRDRSFLLSGSNNGEILLWSVVHSKNDSNSNQLQLLDKKDLGRIGVYK